MWRRKIVLVPLVLAACATAVAVYAWTSYRQMSAAFFPGGQLAPYAGTDNAALGSQIDHLRATAFAIVASGALTLVVTLFTMGIVVCTMLNEAPDHLASGGLRARRTIPDTPAL